MEGVEQSFGFRCRQSCPGVDHRKGNVSVLFRRRPNDDVSERRRLVRHGVDGISKEVHYDLLELHAISDDKG